MAPGYSHSRTLRFWIIRGLPEGEGIRWNFVRTIEANSGLSNAALVSTARSRAVEYPESSSPFGEANRVSARCRRRASAFISSTNASTEPATCSASATAASFADCKSRA
jgi:hypothetical protein